MSLKTKQDPKAIRAAFGKLLNDFSDADKLEMEALAIGHSYLSEAQRVMDDRGMLRKELAERMGMSPSFLTQLFRGDRPLSDRNKALLQRVLEIKFEVTANDLSGRTSLGAFEYPDVIEDDWMQAWHRVDNGSRVLQQQPMKDIEYYEKTA